MLKKALKISLIISIFFAVLLAGAAFLTKTPKDNIKKALFLGLFYYLLI